MTADKEPMSAIVGADLSFLLELIADEISELNPGAIIRTEAIRDGARQLREHDQALRDRITSLEAQLANRSPASPKGATHTDIVERLRARAKHQRESWRDFSGKSDNDLLTRWNVIQRRRAAELEEAAAEIERLRAASLISTKELADLRSAKAALPIEQRRHARARRRVHELERTASREDGARVRELEGALKLVGTKIQDLPRSLTADDIHEICRAALRGTSATPVVSKGKG